MTQTLALFLDAYRELNARKLFWITLALSGLVVASFAFIGINENGLHVIAWDLDLPGLNSKIIKPETFYKLMFTNLGIGFWLAWIATILALVSTAGIIPDFISAGSVDLVLCKPIGRLRLFLTKYATGLLFVALQVTVFSVASFLVLGFKGGTWEIALFLAVPVVTIFYSYLFCICVLLGMLTRSTIASLMLTMLLWFFMFAANTTENAILTGSVMNQHEKKTLEKSITRNEAAIEKLKQRGTEIDFNTASAGLQQLIAKDRTEIDANLNSQRKLDRAHSIAMAVKSVMPKTTETIQLLQRWLVDMADLPAPPGMDEDEGDGGMQPPDQPRGPRRRGAGMDEVQRDVTTTLRSRSLWWVMGTSLTFEAVVLAIAATIFCRRDF